MFPCKLPCFSLISQNIFTKFAKKCFGNLQRYRLKICLKNYQNSVLMWWSCLLKMKWVVIMCKIVNWSWVSIHMHAFFFSCFFRMKKVVRWPHFCFKKFSIFMMQKKRKPSNQSVTLLMNSFPTIRIVKVSKWKTRWQ